MYTALLVFHIFICFTLIFIVLIQGGKGADMGAAFGGGSSQTVFGGRGAATFLNKMTTGVAVIFMVTSLVLAIASVRSGSIIKSQPASQTTSGSVIPAATPGADGNTAPLEAPIQPPPPAR